ncbi:MAG: hypothetical protein PHF44_01890 [Candidatus Pacebacteria bacterium]|nr:hypothetical protein [Candidatus Paceibacterota bacterium]
MEQKVWIMEDCMLDIERFELFSDKFDFGEFSGLYGPGSSKRKEDGWVVTKENIFGVFDAFSEPNSPDHPLLIKEGESLGEINVRTIEKSITEESQGDSVSQTKQLSDIIECANTSVWTVKNVVFSVPREISRLAGASAALVKPDEKLTETITIGDCFLLVSFKNGKPYFSKNQVKKHDKMMHAEISRLKYQIAKEWKINPKKTSQSENKKINDEMWNRFRPFLEKARTEAINNPDLLSGYASLNGDPNLVKMWRINNFNTEDIHKIILFSDGLIPWNLLKNMETNTLGKYIIEMEKRIGLMGIAQSTRSYEEASGFENYVSQHEITAMVLKF